MNLTKIFRTVSVFLVASLGLAFQSHAAVTATFSAGPTCGGAPTAKFSPGGPPVQVSLCMTTTAPTETCGHTIVLQSAPGESGRFVVTAATLGSNYSDPNSEVSQLPLAINNSPIVADFGGTSSGPVVPASNQLLATFTLAPQANATNGEYVISLNSVSTVAVNADTSCGSTMVPGESPIAASFTLSRNDVPVFTSANNATFSTAGSNSFTVTATGVPTPTLSATGVPAGVTFTPATGVLSGTPAVGGPYTITFTAANGVLPNATQTFTLTAAGQAGQTISFANPGTQTFSSSPIALTASASSGLPITFSSQSPFVCTVAGANVTMVSTGTCTIAANQGGNATYLAATTVTQSFGIVATVPGAPTIGAVTAGNAQLNVAFTAPASTGGSPILSYTATCGGISATGNSSPITVAGLTNGVAYSCTVTATNALGTGLASAAAVGTPSAASALTLVEVHSRKTHGSAGTFDLPIDTSVAALSGNVTVEPRLVLTGHQIVFIFNSAVTSVTSASTVDSASVTGIGSPTMSFAGNEVIVTLTGAVLDNKRLTVQLTGVNGTLNTLVHVGFLVGDVTNSRTVNGTDIVQVKGRSVTNTDASNFMYDINASGSITGTDIVQVKGRSISSLNP